MIDGANQEACGESLKSESNSVRKLLLAGDFDYSLQQKRRCSIWLLVPLSRLANVSKEKSEVIWSPLSFLEIFGQPRETQLIVAQLEIHEPDMDRTAHAGKVIVKTAPQRRLENERDVLKHFSSHPYIRQVLDETIDPPSLILQYLDDNLLHASSVKTLENSDVKLVAKRVLQAIWALHEEGYTHTGRLS